MIHSSEKKFSSSTVSINDLISLATIFKNILGNAKNSRRFIQFKVSYTNGRTDQCSDEISLKKVLDIAAPRDIQGLSFDCYGDKADAHFSYFKQWSDVKISIKSTDKGLLLKYEEETAKIFKSQNRNYLIHNYPFIRAVLFFFSGIVVSLVLLFGVPQISSLSVGVNISNSKSLMTSFTSFLVIVLPFILYLTTDSYLQTLYPKLVIAHGDQKSGREFNRDIKWVIIAILTLIIFPILTNRV